LSRHDVFYSGEHGLEAFSFAGGRELCATATEAYADVLAKYPMIDLLFIAMTIGFFLLSIAYTYGCQKLRGGSDG
jgi:hypothetical protein